MTRKSELWTTMKMLAFTAIVISPFWFLARNLSSDEFQKSGLSAALATAVAVVVGSVGRRRDG